MCPRMEVNLHVPVEFKLSGEKDRADSQWTPVTRMYAEITNLDSKTELCHAFKVPCLCRLLVYYLLYYFGNSCFV